MDTASIDHSNLGIIRACDLEAAAARALSVCPTERIEHAVIGGIELLFFPDHLRGGAVDNGDAVWFDADSMDDLHEQAKAAFTPQEPTTDA